MFIHVVSSRGEKEEKEEGDDFQNARTGLIAVRRVVVERRRVRAQPAALAQVDALLRREVPRPRRVGLRAEAHLVGDLEAVANAE